MLQVSQVPTPPPAPEIPDWLFQRGPDPVEIAIAVAIVLSSLGAISILWMFARGLIRKWTQPAIQLDAVQEVQQAVQRLTDEVGELHERMDFAERMLAQHREPARLERQGE